MKKIDFAYNEPRLGQIEIDGPDVSEEDVLKMIENEYPEAIDVEIINEEVFN